MMLLIDQKGTDPFFNLALEEHLFKNVEEDVLMLWQSDNAIVVGKHQNTYREINLEFVQDHEIQIARRLSGGGAVYHDLGNLNFTFIRNGEKGKLIDFARFVQPVIKALNGMGLETYQGKRNEIMLAGMKISGNAEHTFKNRVLHHGTLLFNSNLGVLMKSLRINPFKYKDKAIKSVQSRVTNIQNHLPKPISFDEFRGSLLSTLMEDFGVRKQHELSKEDEQKTNELVKEKYHTWEWNYGYSPNYELDRSFQFRGETYHVSLAVKRGKIEKATFTPSLNELGDMICGELHKPDLIGKILTSQGLTGLSPNLF